MHAHAQILESPSAAFQVHKQEVGGKVEHPECEPVPVWDASTIGRGLSYYAMMPELNMIIFPRNNVKNEVQHIT